MGTALSRSIRSALGVALALLSGARGEAQEAKAPTLEDLIAANGHVLELGEHGLAGPGADFLKRATEGTQFLVLGEEHYVAEVPELVTALFRMLQETQGYQYVALESDPLSASLACTGELRGKREAIVAYAQRFPHAFTFPSEQELAMIADVGKLSRGRGEPVWGLDQMFGAAHALEWLRSRAEDAESKAALAGLLARIDPIEKVRGENTPHFLADRGKPEEFYKLRELVGAKPGSDEAFCVDQLLLSDEIYRPYTDREFGAGPGVFQASGLAREENMKQLLLRQYRRAQAAGDALPKAILKLGHWHTAYGRYPESRLLTLGNFAHEFATSNGLGSFSIGIAVHGPSGHWRELAKQPGWARVAEACDPEAWTLVDLRPLRVYEAEVRKASPVFADYLWMFDALLVMGGARPATFPG